LARLRERTYRPPRAFADLIALWLRLISSALIRRDPGGCLLYSSRKMDTPNAGCTEKLALAFESHFHHAVAKIGFEGSSSEGCSFCRFATGN
jgi:hypothetical protein